METIGIKKRSYGDYRVYILGFYWDNGKEKGNYYSGFRV